MDGGTRRRSTGQRKPRRKSANAKMRAYRERMRAAGLRQVQIWVPDSTSPSLRREARRQSILVSRSPAEEQALQDIEGLADLEDWK
jgi:hypothetical protein